MGFGGKVGEAADLRFEDSGHKSRVIEPRNNADRSRLSVFVCVHPPWFQSKGAWLKRSRH
jgi:hypothetical protein